MSEKKFWRCNVCSDIHYGVAGPEICPTCRLRDGTREMDIQLICPCNFKIQDTWKTKGECWCGLFIKRK